MKLSEAIGMMMRGLAENVQHTCERIEATEWSPSEKERQMFATMEAAVKEFEERGRATVLHFMNDNQNSRLDFSQLGGSHCEFGPEARKPHLSAWQQVKGEVA